MSALIADGPPSWLLEEAIEGRIELVLPDRVLSELERVLQKKLGFSRRRCREATRFLSQLASERPTAPESADPVTGDPDDDVILACAVLSGVEFLATGDHRHLLPLGEYKGLRLVTPQALLRHLRTRVTRNGVPVGELAPLRQRQFVTAEAAVAAFAGAPTVELQRFRADVDRLLDQDPLPRG